MVLWFGREVSDITRPWRELNLSIHQDSSGGVWNAMLKHMVASLEDTEVGKVVFGTRFCCWFEPTREKGSR